MKWILPNSCVGLRKYLSFAFLMFSSLYHDIFSSSYIADHSAIHEIKDFEGILTCRLYVLICHSIQVLITMEIEQEYV